MAVSEAEAIKDLADEEVEDLRETFRTFDKVRTQPTHALKNASFFVFVYVTHSARLKLSVVWPAGPPPIPC